MGVNFTNTQIARSRFSYVFMVSIYLQAGNGSSQGANPEKSTDIDLKTDACSP